ncbi:Transcriptional regulator, LysR family protein [Modestobacter italicus]|uniref:Transcriptional regulator, LysR family protein n=1 Tax=Modestobacter italicus (strain DSM 44449 / CECT 9708 / BC 501) TaxID=2732864 RepID=I4EVM2_MODI5|nr:LysR family transcriptional regulator [Modestobacter marinus]CCH87435.1 Transcriptional regulator, LysR family protein [Modestobacter marinus]
MELRQLRYFVAVAEERRFSAAARRLHIAAPSLSQQIRALERDLRVTLFERTPRGAELTAAGLVLADRARVILAEVDRARRDVQSAGPGHRETVTLRVCTMAERVLDGPLRHIGSAVPGAAVTVTSSPGDDAVEAVRQGRADAAVVWNRPPEHRDLDGLVLGSVLLGIVLPAGHRLAARPDVPVAELGSESTVMFPWSPFAGVWQRTVDHLLPGGAQQGQVVIEPDLINSPEAMLRAVAAGGGIAPGILGVAEQMDVGGIVVLPLDPPLVLDLEVVWRPPARPAVRRLVDHLVRSVDDPGVLVTAPRRPPGAVRVMG